MRKFILAGTVASVALLLAAPVASAQDQGDADTAQSEEEEREHITITGSRLRGGDETARVEVITAEEIRQRGLTTAEDIVRVIPQNFSSINSGNNVLNGNSIDTNLGAFGLGTSTANLRGLGSANTLVLINGRRIAGDAGNLDFFANIRDIPAASIERVEILLDGGSAIYGADAVAGVINIILKKNFSGGQLNARYENSNTGGDLYRFSGNYGHSWGTGNASVTASFTKSDPISTAKTGFTTLDYRDRFDGDPLANFRGLATPFSVGGTGLRSARICNPDVFPFCSRFGRFDFILPAGNDGTDFELSDLVPVTVDDFLGFIEPDIGGSTEDISVTANLEQTIAERLTLRGDFLYTRSVTKSAVNQLAAASFTVPASNAFNPTDQTLFVQYDPAREIAAGLVSLPRQEARNEQIRFAIGADLEITERLALTVDYNRSESQGDGIQFNYSSSVRPEVLAFNPQLEGVNERLAELLASSDPSVAVNLFGDGTAQNPTIAEFLIPVSTVNNKSINEEVIGYFDGTIFDLPGGAISFVAGGEYRSESVADLLSQTDARGSLLDRLGLARPSRDLKAGFGEIKIPIFGENNAVTGIQSLVLTAQLRYDQYSITAADGRDTNGDPNLETAKFDNLTTRFGVAWQPNEELLVRVSRSEGFRAPTANDLFGTFTLNLPTVIFDPLLGTFVPGILNLANSPDLQPETSVNWTAGARYTPNWLPGLLVQVDYAIIDFTNRIASSNELRILLPDEIFGNLEEFFVRDENGTLLQNNNKSINISRRVSETVDVDVSYLFDTDWGTFTPGVNLSYTIKQFDQAFPGVEKVSFVGETQGIDRYRLQGRLNWVRDNISADLFVYYTPSYENTNFEDTIRDGLPVPRVSDRTTVDLTAAYRFDNGLTLRAGGRNIFNADFPFALNLSGDPHDAQRVDLRGRVFFIEASFEFGGLLGNL